MGIGDGQTNPKLVSSDLRSSGFVARPKAQSWRGMYEPSALTVSITCWKWGSDRTLSVNVNEAYLPGLDLFAGTNIWSMEVRPAVARWMVVASVIKSDPGAEERCP